MTKVLVGLLASLSLTAETTMPLVKFEKNAKIGFVLGEGEKFCGDYFVVTAREGKEYVYFQPLSQVEGKDYLLLIIQPKWNLIVHFAGVSTPTVRKAPQAKYEVVINERDHERARDCLPPPENLILAA
ncbi:MAG TPA: hypothetical protein VI336_00765, partial [Candidatus Saccharimonadales bacterium]|nr:hypothetical protein [Candidatus Saccharimonadales bacterium]